MIGALLVFAQIGSVQFQTTARPETVYVGQQVNYDAVTLVDPTARERLRANPLFTPSDVAGVTTYDFPFDTKSIGDTVVSGVKYRRYVYHRALFPLAPGRYDIGPASLQYTLPDGVDYFSPARQFTDQSSPTSFVALQLPTAGRPVGFTGAVGEFKDTLRTDGSQPKLGDTFMVTMRVAGLGNLKLLPRPPLQIDWATVVPGGERVSWDSTGTAVRGSKEFDWVVTPRIAGDMVLPAVRYDYFNPSTGRYEVSVTPAIPLAVAPATGAPAAQQQARDTIGDTPFPSLMRMARDNALAIAIAASALVVVALIWIALGRRRKSDGSGTDPDEE